MKTIKAIVFELDDVLIETSEWHYRALNRALGHFGFSIAFDERDVNHDWRSTRQRLEKLTVERGLPVALHGLIWKLKQQYAIEEIHANCTVREDKAWMLRQLGRDGYRLVACSGLPRFAVAQILLRTELAQDLECAFADVDADRDGYRYAIARLGVEPERTMIVARRVWGYWHGKGTGAHVCAVSRFSEVDYLRIQQFIGDLRVKWFLEDLPRSNDVEATRAAQAVGAIA